jgi:DNA-binding Lrp family transcriptional regulator
LLDSINGIIKRAGIGVAHTGFTEAVLSVAVTDVSIPTVESDLIEQLKKQFANFKIPKCIFIELNYPATKWAKRKKFIARTTVSAMVASYFNTMSPRLSATATASVRRFTASFAITAVT